MPRETRIASIITDIFGVVLWLSVVAIAGLTLSDFWAASDAAGGGLIGIAAFVAASGGFMVAGLLTVIGTLALGFSAVVRAIWQSRG